MSNQTTIHIFNKILNYLSTKDKISFKCVNTFFNIAHRKNIKLLGFDLIPWSNIINDKHLIDFKNAMHIRLGDCPMSNIYF